jgi:hypothetical protein
MLPENTDSMDQEKNISPSPSPADTILRKLNKMNIHVVRILLVLLVSSIFATLTGGIYLLSIYIPVTERTITTKNETSPTDVSENNDETMSPSSISNMDPTSAKSQPTISNSVTTTSGFEGFLKLSLNDDIQLNGSVTIRFTTASFISAEEVNKAKGTSVPGELIKKENQGLAVYFEIKNTSQDPQSIIGIGETSPFLISDDSGKSILVTESIINPFNAAALITIPANQTITNALLFEIPKGYTNINGLNLVYFHPKFQPSKAYIPL